MKPKDPRLRLQAAPLLRQEITTPRAMRDVMSALLPAVLAGLWFFGLGALLVLLASIAGAVLTEWAFSPAEQRAGRLLDGSGLLTGLCWASPCRPRCPCGSPSSGAPYPSASAS
jgi:electron transport complex protein RnfD